MKCPECKAWTAVESTRIQPDGTPHRVRVCANNHRFKTKETMIPFEKRHKNHVDVTKHLPTNEWRD
jgi:transcriptional regulator NrdR family protein